MKLHYMLSYLLISCLCVKYIYGAIPLLPLAAIATATVFSGSVLLKDRVMCQFKECCIEKYIHFNSTAFNIMLEEKLYGQHIVVQSLTSAIKGHLMDKQPSKALVLSLNGPTGTGKNYAIQLLANSMYTLGTKSQFYHFFSATRHFPFENLVDTYAENLSNWISGNVSLCARSMFVFDEMDKMPVKLMDSLATFLESHDHVDRIDFRKTIFIFLGNAGSSVIMNKTLQVLKAGRKREEITILELDKSISQESYKSSGGFEKSQLLKKHLISRFIPFLPLERPHVLACIRDYLLTQHPILAADSEFIDKVADQLEFIPSRELFFSSTGCKRVPDKAAMLVELQHGNFDTGDNINVEL